MQIALKPSYKVKRNWEIIVIGRIEQYLIDIGVRELKIDENYISGAHLYTGLLVPPRSGIRITQNTEEITTEKREEDLEKLYIKKYGCLPQVPETQRISTTTAVLINLFLDGKIRENAVLSMPVWRKNICLLETEVILPNSDIEEGEKLLMKIIELFLPGHIKFSVNPTWFSWAAQAESFRIEDKKEKWGAIGVLRPEIINLRKANSTEETAVIVGIPVKTLAKYCAVLKSDSLY